MREIKFRAWHLFGKSIQPKKAGMIYDNKPGDCLKWKQEGQDITHIEQFTGLHDKKGVEIYEGDILGWHAMPEANGDGIVFNFSKKSTVHWCQDAWAVFINEHAEEATLSQVTEQQFPDCEVIGNIHESETK